MSSDSFIRTAEPGDDSDVYVAGGGPKRLANQDLIAAARTQLPRLIDEVRRLRGRIDHGDIDER
jgi:hypothetical protein